MFKLTKTAKNFGVVFVVLILIILTGIKQKSESASLTSVSATLSNSRLSFWGGLTTGNSEGSSTVIINTTPGDFPSTTSAQLVTDDVLAIGNGSGLSSYTVTAFTSASTMTVSPVLGTGDADSGDPVFSTQSGNLKVRFTTANAIANGRFRVLVPALSNDTNAADGLPDAGFFDFGASAPTVTCPDDISGYDFVAGTATASAITVNSVDYHSYECAYSGNGAIGSAFDGTTNDYIEISNIINPAPKSAHTIGTADTYNVIVHHINSSFSVADSTTINIGAIESVRVTATVAPQITFQIYGVNSGTSVCGQTTDVTTTPASVPFGELSITAFTDAAQALSVSTNATGGYSVTARANDQLGRNGGTCTGDNTGSDCIRDSAGNNSTMAHDTVDEWTSTSAKGFGYTLDDANTSGLTAAFEWDSTAGTCDGTYCAKQFADTEDSQTAQTLFSATDPADNHNLYVCYKAIISATTSAGDYENNIIYTATATF